MKMRMKVRKVRMNRIGGVCDSTILFLSFFENIKKPEWSI